jgi:glycosyltransferase involved in cell wall biosynthesis
MKTDYHSFPLLVRPKEEFWMPTETECELTILMPCLNEAETLATCIQKANDFLARAGINGEVLISDNGSTDGSVDIALSARARVVHADQKGYGAALANGIAQARGEYVIMGDADDSYDFTNLAPFVEKLRAGYDLVMGNRFTGGIAPGAMPKLHYYLGNPLLSGIGKLFFKSPIDDFHCGLRGFRREAILSLNLNTTGMEFASEMVVKATLAKLKITEVPTTLSPDGRSRPPHLRSWRDGWRHLRFLLLFSPKWLFFYPSLICLAFGLILMLSLLFFKVEMGGIRLGIHSLILSGILVILGVQILSFAFLAKMLGTSYGIFPTGPVFGDLLSGANLDRAAPWGLAVFICGLLIIIGTFLYWASTGFGDLDYHLVIKLVVPGATMLVVGIQMIAAAFLAGLIRLGHFDQHGSELTL